jgi:hypothetical protein
MFPGSYLENAFSIGLVLGCFQVANWKMLLVLVYWNEFRVSVTAKIFPNSLLENAFSIGVV